MTGTIIYKICTAADWVAAETEGVFAGSAADRADGFLHFSTAAQLRETAARHFAGRSGLVLLTVDAGRLGPGLRCGSRRAAVPGSRISTARCRWRRSGQSTRCRSGRRAGIDSRRQSSPARIVRRP